MTGAGVRTRERFERNMQAIAVGATLARRKSWIVTSQQHMYTSVILTLRHGHRTLSVNVPVCITGPVLWQVGLRAVSAAPVQRELLMGDPA
jgi:hypothetical protein